MSRERLGLTAPVRGARLLAHGEESVRARLLQRARAEGERAGREAAARELEAVVEAIQGQAEEARAGLASAATELGLEIARTLLRAELRRDGHAIEKIVRETLSEAAVGRAPCVVHLHPADHARLAEVRFRSGTRLEPDEGVARGGVHVETALGLFVRDLDAALDAIEKRLKEELA